ncbi:MAG: GNAT family N-acetyltransferase [Bacteroidia bacterium]
MSFQNATYKDKNLIVDILCKSFDLNFSVNYVVKQDSKRKKRIRVLMEYSFELCYMFGKIYLSNNKEACALILFPDKKKMSLKTILLDVKMALAAVGVKRVTTVLARDLKIKNSYPNNKILYLWFIGVNPDVQQKGIGSNLLEVIIQESIKLERPIYLETSMPENIQFYNKFGFKIYKELDFGHTLYLIRRAQNYN